MTIKTWSYISYIFEKHNIYDSRQGSRFFVVFAIILQKSKRLISNSSKHFETGLVNEVIRFLKMFLFLSSFDWHDIYANIWNWWSLILKTEKREIKNVWKRSYITDQPLGELYIFGYKFTDLTNKQTYKQTKDKAVPPSELI